MKRADLEPILDRFKSHPRAQSLEVNIRGRKRPISFSSVEVMAGALANLDPETIVAISATYGPVVPLPEGARQTSQGIYFASKESGAAYAVAMAKAWPHHLGKISLKAALACTHKRGKSWRVLTRSYKGADPLF